MKQKYLIKGLIKSIPGIELLYNFHKRTGGDTESARYCYSVWLRHLVLAHQNGRQIIPATLAELGPGNSFGVGIAALLTGVKKYYGLDAIRYTNSAINLQILNSLVSLFLNKSPIPDNTEFPLLEPRLNDYSFPETIITDTVLSQIRQGDWVAKIADAIADIDRDKPNDLITYSAPWLSVDIEKGSIDMIVSQTVLQHADQVEIAYARMNRWLKETGLLSHTIDFGCMLSSDEWNGHWTYSDRQWKILRGRKSFYINRLPLSQHINLLGENGFDVICLQKKKETNSLKRAQLAQNFSNLGNDDLETSVVFYQAAKTHCK